MYYSAQTYGTPPAATPQLLAAPHPHSTAAPRSPVRGRPGTGEPAMSGDPVLVWVVLLGVAIALGWVSFSLQVG